MEIISALIQLFGGLAMFLYGIELMGDGLKNSSGAALKRVLEKVTGNVLLGVLTGTAVTAVVQSSTATIVLTVALLGAGVLNLKQSVSIVMGANIGTTVTAQIIRLGSIESDGSFLLWLFDTDTLAPIALIIGIVLLMFIKKRSAKPVGDVCIGFGILFVGLNLMTGGVKPLIGTEAFASFVNILNNPILGILFGLILTVIVQSSSATVGMLQTVASVPGSGITFAMAYPIIMGINLGTCVTTAMVCSIGSSKDAKRTGIVHIAFNTIGTILFMAVMYLLQSKGIFGERLWAGEVNSGIIANFQTIFNLVTAIVLLPFTQLLVKLSMVIVRDEPEKPSAHPELNTLDEKLCISPAVAVSEATKAVAAMGELAMENFCRGCEQLLSYDDEKAKLIDEEEDFLDRFADRFNRFAIALNKTVETQADERQLDMLMQTVPDFERIGDYATNLCELGEKLRNDGGDFSGTAVQELKILIESVKEILSLTMNAFSRDDDKMAGSIEPLEETIDDMVMILKDRHTKRLKSGDCVVGAGLIFMEALTYFERASDQCSTVAVMMLARHNEDILQDHYLYLRQIHEGNDEEYRKELEHHRERYIKPLKEIK